MKNKEVTNGSAGIKGVHKRNFLPASQESAFLGVY
jgi:hypothetical protein